MKKSPRRRFLSASGSLVFGSLLAGCSGKSTPSTSDRNTRIEQTTTTHPESVRWQADLGGAVRYAPNVLEGTVYVPGSDLYALDTTSGTEQWRFHDDGLIDSTPILSDGTSYVISGTPTPRPQNYSVYAVDVTSGTERWQFTESQFEEEIELALLDVSSDVVYVTAYTAQGGTTTYAVDAGGGKKRWQVELGSTADTGLASGDALYLGTADGLYAISATDGSKQWKYEAAERAEPTVVRDTLFVPAEDGLVGLRPTDGSVVWEYTPQSPVTASIVTDDTVYVGTNAGQLYAIDAETATTDWNYTLDSTVADVSVADDAVYAGTRYGTLHAIDAKSGERRWKTDRSSYLLGSLTATRTIIYSYTYDPYSITARRRDNGTLLWSFSEDAALTAPTVTADAAYVGSDSGFVYALTTDGAQ